MNKIQQKQLRDWLNAWTILVLPMLGIWILFLLRAAFPIIENVYDPVAEVGIFGNAVILEQMWTFFLLMCFLILPPFCFFWSIAHYFFVKNTRKKNASLRRVQIAFNVVLSLLYLVAIILFLVEIFRPRPNPYPTLSPEFFEEVRSAHPAADSPNR